MSRYFEFGEAYYRGLRDQSPVLVDMETMERSIISGDAGRALLELMTVYKSVPMPDGKLAALIQRAMAGWLLRAGVSPSTDCTHAVQPISTAPPSDASVRRAGRLLAMIHELHKAGYQRIRIASGMAPSGCYWRCHVTTADNVQPNGWEPIKWEEGVLRYSSADQDRFFGWADASGKNARQLAQMFISRFPDMARKGSGRDHPYAGWFVGILGAAENGRLPVFFADYDLDSVETEMPPPPLGARMEVVDSGQGTTAHEGIQAPPRLDREVVVASGQGWWLEIGPVDLNGELVTIQRNNELIAAIVRRDDGRLRAATFHPLDAESAKCLIQLAGKRYPDDGVSIESSIWEYARNRSSRIGNAYAAYGGQAYLSYWEKGIGIHSDGTESPIYRPYKDLIARPAGLVAAELDAHYSSSAEQDAADIDDADRADDPQWSAVPRWRSKRQQRKTIQGKYLGCLLGGAVGDALGAPVEFMKRTEILSRFGPNGITSYAPAYGGIGTITDDTQMTLFTAEGLLRAWVRQCSKGITTYSGLTARSYLRWLRTQGEVNRYNIDAVEYESGWLFQQEGLHSRRAPGNTCLSALREMPSPGAPARNDSKGCGGVMRMAPVGLFAWRIHHEDQAPWEAFRLGTELAALTHGHPTGALSAGVLAVLIQALTDGAPLEDAVATAKACLCMEPRHEETLHAIEQAEELSSSALPHDEAISRLGHGWVAEEALAISIYCAMVARSFKQGIILAVNHDGDSDSTGAIVGNLLGAMLGAKAIPEDWLEPLELRSVITEIAEDLYDFRDWEIGQYSNSHSAPIKS
jgi:ADP-ribosylglycohydrolase